ncbi:methyl-accepting chemotaxis protein [Geomesophilobacter sediminis]|uniref:Methyl-accepting chemotaxis protein n=1 Tax=Geomesophilobacter sediminis TaxID=2798584 RepID=A0A8J7LXR9_9BACT|nr:methyl-accepting chemotaxis protein [Geomesophilobacter sediminis]MBJ6723586.1 methyl-accepting chemotaxis protein [Geomesophilobacter sediminis]
MFLRRYLTSLRTTYRFMVCFGLLMGLVFPFYSYLFFGPRAFSPFYVLGCLVAGFAVGSFCYYLVRQVLGVHLERQHQSIAALSSHPVPKADDELEALLAFHELMVTRIVTMAGEVSTLIEHLAPLHAQLAARFVEIARGSETQSSKARQTLHTVAEVNHFFAVVLSEIDDLSRRTEARTALSKQMTDTTDIIAENIREYSASVLETSSSIQEMAMGVKQNATIIQSLATSTEQTVGSIAQIGSAISHVRDNAQNAADSSEGVRRQAQGGLLYMATTLKAMREIEKSNEESFDAINRLSIHSARVGEFLNVIQEVVEQTNLLSLNASIIAAQAGERGKAFGIVAEEVRSLAQRTSLSAKEIGDLVKNIQKETAAVQRAVTQGKSRVKDGVKISGQTNEALVKIESGAAEASEMVKRIAAATVEQAAQSRLISEEAEKNLQRVKSASGTTKRQEEGISDILNSLEHMRLLSQKIDFSIQEQGRGNRLYLQSVMEDNERVRKLQENALQQSRIGEALQQFVQEVTAMIERNSSAADEMSGTVAEIAQRCSDLEASTRPFLPEREHPEPPLCQAAEADPPAP